MSKAISWQQVQQYQQELQQQPGHAALARAVQNVGIKAASRQQLGQAAFAPVFSDEIPTGVVTNQKHSGRCWMFAELNTMRHAVSGKFGVKNLEFSQAFLAFYDRLEKSNQFLNQMIANVAAPIGSRKLDWYLTWANGDGGQYENAASLIAKYGVIPKSVMPETYNSDNTTELNATLNLKLRQDAVALRQAYASGATPDQLAAQRVQQLSTIYRILAYAYGEPPRQFDFEYMDDQHQYHRVPGLTPRSFFDQFLGWDFDQYVMLISTNATGKEYWHSYTLPSQDHVEGGRRILWVNVPEAVLEQAAIQQIQGGETVWFGNDVLADSDRQSGTLVGDLYAQSELFGVDLHMDVGTRFDTHQAEVSHAMVLTGVDLVKGAPTKWKVENSWAPPMDTTATLSRMSGGSRTTLTQ
nr:C1 family peptidase [Lacticaseibacillus thailandensis]